MPKKLAEKEIKQPEKVGGYLLVNHEKLDRVINGVLGREGRLEGGLGQGANDAAVLAQYDKLGGLVMTSEGEKLATGSFYDFANKKPREKPAPVAKVESKAKTGTENVGDDEPKKKRKAKSPADEAIDA